MQYCILTCGNAGDARPMWLSRTVWCTAPSWALLPWSASLWGAILTLSKYAVDPRCGFLDLFHSAELHASPSLQNATLDPNFSKLGFVLFAPASPLQSERATSRVTQGSYLLCLLFQGPQSWGVCWPLLEKWCVPSITHFSSCLLWSLCPS